MGKYYSDMFPIQSGLR